MSSVVDKNDVIFNKKDAIKKLNALLESYINDPTGKYLKKANILSFWLKDYVNYIKLEEKFDPKRNIAYKRGNVVKVGFGFNVGSGYGGLHYAVVLDNKNPHNSPVVTVVPLTSAKAEKEVHPCNVPLGNDLYIRLNSKYNKIQKSLEAEAEEINKINGLVTSVIDAAKTNLIETDSQVLDAVQELKAKKLENEKKKKELLKIGAEISDMKEGSIALVNQITTISKMRIYDPRNLNGVLSGISLSEESMEKINQKVKELFVF